MIKIIGSYQRSEKVMEYEGDIHCSRYVWYTSHRVQKDTGGIGYQKKNIDHSIVKIDLNKRLLKTWWNLLSLSLRWMNTRRIIIIMSRHQHGYPWPLLATLPYRPLLPESFQGYIPYRHRAAARILRKVLETWCLSDSSERPPANASVENTP